MKPAEAFAALKDLQDATGATDAQLDAMLLYGCANESGVTHEDVITEHLLRLFRYITGVPWVRGWEQGARLDRQYGTIWIYGSTTVGAPEIEYTKVIDQTTMLPLDDLCESSSQVFDYQFQLDSYRDNGDANRGQEIATKQGREFSAFDVLTHLVTAIGHPRYRRALAEKNICLGTPTFGAIRNLSKAMVQNTFEGRASVDFFVRVRKRTTMRTPTFNSVDWTFMCPPDNLLFPTPTQPVEC